MNTSPGHVPPPISMPAPQTTDKMDRIDQVPGTFDTRLEKQKRAAPAAAAVARLPRYYRALSHLLAAGVLRVSSEELGALMGGNPSQIRQDLRQFGDFGQQGYGYQVRLLHRKLGSLFGLGVPHPAVTVGDGAPAVPLVGSGFFAQFGVTPVLHLSGSDAPGAAVTDHPSRPWSERAEALAETPVEIAILFTRPEVTSEAVTALYALGVRAFFNCTGVPVTAVPDGAHIRDFAPEEPLLGLLYDLRRDEQTKEDENAATL